MPHYRISTWMIWRKGWIEERTLQKMDDHLDHTTPNHHPPKMDVQKLVFKASLLLIGKCSIQVPNSCDDLCLLFCWLLLLWFKAVWRIQNVLMQIWIRIRLFKLTRIRIRICILLLGWEIDFLQIFYYCFQSLPKLVMCNFLSNNAGESVRGEG